MSRNQVIVRMKDGATHHLMGFASDVQEKVNEARGEGKLIPLERDLIPTGQQVWLDPDEVASVQDSGW